MPQPNLAISEGVPHEPLSPKTELVIQDKIKNKIKNKAKPYSLSSSSSKSSSSSSQLVHIFILQL